MLPFMAKISVTVPDDVLVTWREAAQVQGSSLSGLVAEWMGELQPGLADVVRLGKALQHATASQKIALRDAVTAAEAAVQPALTDAFGTLSDVADFAQGKDPHLSNRGVR